MCYKVVQSLNKPTQNQKLLHLWFCGNNEAYSSWFLQTLCGSWLTFLTRPILHICGFGGVQI
jgi:hypothetical protein